MRHVPLPVMAIRSQPRFAQTFLHALAREYYRYKLWKGEMATKQHTKQAWRIVADPHAPEHKWLAACAALGPDAKRGTLPLPSLPPVLATALSSAAGLMASFGALLCLLMWSLSTLTLCGISSLNIDTMVSFLIFMTGILPAVAAFNAGWFERQPSRLSEGAWMFPAAFMSTWMTCTHYRHEGLWLILWTALAFISAKAAYSCAKFIAGRCSKFVDVMRLGMPGFVPLIAWSLITFWGIGYALQHPTHGQGTPLEVSGAMVMLLVVGAQSYLTGIWAESNCKSNRWQTAIAAAVLTNLPLVVGLIFGALAASFFASLNLMGLRAATSALPTALSFLLSACSIIGLAAAGGAISWTARRRYRSSAAEDSGRGLIASEAQSASQ